MAHTLQLSSHSDRCRQIVPGLQNMGALIGRNILALRVPQTRYAPIIHSSI